MKPNAARAPAVAAPPSNFVQALAGQLRSVELKVRRGRVRGLGRLSIDADGPRTHIGELCAILPSGASVPSASRHQLLEEWAQAPGAPVLAEVVAVGPTQVTLMPYGGMEGLAVGSTVLGLGTHSTVGVGDALLGRVIDAFGRPLDGKGPVGLDRVASLKGEPANPMHRPRIDQRLDTGVRCIDGLLTVGRGQRVGIFAGSGVGKSTLLGMIARHVAADVNVIALIGERGREVREFVEKQLGREGLRRSVVVVAAADQPALNRIRAAHAALAIAEDFRAQGRQVLLTMDSITRLAMARREVGLAAGEPPTARGYTPSVFAELPQLCERCGTAASGGSITALLTVLVEGDDMNEPIADALRAILDGHIVLSRQLAHQGQYPAIDVLKSASRLLPELTSPDERSLIHEAIRVIALLDRNQQMVELGAYETGSNPELDAALSVLPGLRSWLRQTDGGAAREQTMAGLRDWRDTLLAAAARPGGEQPPGHGAGTGVQAPVVRGRSAQTVDAPRKSR